MEKNFKFSFLSANIIKILGAIFMVIDHIGVILFPNVIFLRILGRLSMPLFAYMIAEGAHYTKNKLKYFLLIFGLGVIFQVVFYAIEQSLYMGILITFSTSILIIYALQLFKAKIFNKTIVLTILSFLLFATSIVITFFLNKYLQIDYGFWGCLLPVFASVFRLKIDNSKSVKTFDNVPLNVLTFSVALIFIRTPLGTIQNYALLTLPILLLYSGKRGKINLKFFFYIFYPLHLVIIYAISYFIN